MGWERNSGHEEFHLDAAKALEEYQALARDIMKTLPPEDWPVWVKNLNKKPVEPVDTTPYGMDDSASDLTLPENWGKTADMWPFKKEEQPPPYPPAEQLEWETGISNVIPKGINVHSPDICPTCGRPKNPGSDFCPYCFTPYDQAPDPETQRMWGFHPSQYPHHIYQGWMKAIEERSAPLKGQRYEQDGWERLTVASPQMIQWLDSRVSPELRQSFNDYKQQLLRSNNNKEPRPFTVSIWKLLNQWRINREQDRRLKEQMQNLPVFNGSWNPFKRTSKIAQSPAVYSEDDPLDMGVVEEMVNDLHSEWWLETPERQRQAIANAFRAALVSPRQNLYWNSVVYQHLMEVPPEESDPDVFEQLIRKRKAKWDNFGQQTIDQITQTSGDPELIDHVQHGGVSKYMPGIWGNIRNCALIGPYIEQLRQAALADIAQGGDGNLFRQLLLEMNINGIGPKIAAFVWLLLCPKTSRLATIDIHMMRHLGEQADSPRDYTAYRNFERKLDQQRKDMGYPDVPLGAFQWALWDRQRTPGYHQDHTPLRPLDPVDYNNIDWAPQARTRKTPLVEVSPDQQSLFEDQPDQQEEPPEGWKVLQ